MLPQEEKHKWILRIPIFFENHTANILSWLSPIAVIVLTVLAFLDDISFWWIASIGFVAAASLVLGNILQTRQDGSIRAAELRSTILQQDQEDAANYLRRVIQQQVVDLLDETNIVNDHTRVSIYQHDPQRGKFIPVGRRSSNPELEEWGRPEYPDNYGIIREAWTGQKVFKFRLSGDPEEWAEEQNRLYDVPLEVARNIRMKSRSYIGLRIDYGPAATKVGIAILESLTPQGVSSSMADTVMGTDAFYNLALALAVGPKPPRSSFKDAAS